jgi:hypothetical protein
MNQIKIASSKVNIKSEVMDEIKQKEAIWKNSISARLLDMQLLVG